MTYVKIAVTLSMLLLAIPALAQPPRHVSAHSTARAVTSPDAVFLGGRYLGQAPDPNIRFELRRDAAEYLGED
jgi:hypothetical protein